MEDAIEGDCEYTSIYIHSEKAKKLGLNNGDRVEVECIGPTRKDDPCVYHEGAIGNKERGRIKITEGVDPQTLWIYFAVGHRSKFMLEKAQRGVGANWLIPSSVSPYAAGTGKNYSIVKIRKVQG